MIVYNTNGNKIKEIGFDYDYFNSDCDLFFDDEYLCHRLRLESVTEKADGKSLPPYEFSYNSTSLPSRISYEQDYWGFYNANNASTFIPNIWAYPGDNNSSYLSHFSVFQRDTYDGQEYLINPGADRSSNTSVIQAGVLNRIKYPTGGFAVYAYEPHQFYFDGSNKFGGGIRIKKAIAKTSSTSSAFEKEYIYTMYDDPSISSGRIIRLPEFAFWRTNIVFSTNVASIEEMREATFITTQTMSSLEEAQGSYVAYKEVAIIENSNGKTIKIFHLPATAEDIDYDCEGGNCIYNRSSANSLYGVYLCQPPTGGYSYYYKHLFGNYDNYPYAPNPNYNWSRGDIKEELVFKEGDFTNPIKKTVYAYDIKNYEKIPSVRFGTIGFLNDGPITACSQLFQGGGYDPPEISVYDINKYSYYYSISAWKVLSAVTEFNYFDSNIVESTTTYDFESPNHKLVTKRTVSNSDQIDNITEFIYPPDVVDPNGFHTSQDVIDKMNEDNMLNHIIKAEESKNNIEIEGIINAYDFNTNNVNQIVKKSVLNLEGDDYVANEEYLYDIIGNPIQIRNINGITTTYLWGYNYQYPIAKIENAKYSEVIGLLNVLYPDLQLKNSIQLIDILNSLRQKPEMNNSLVNSYTYDPLIGMTTETDPNGTVLKYNYDEFNRLETITDRDNNVIKHVDYNYGFNATLNNNSYYSHGEIATFSVSVSGGSGSFSYNWNFSCDGIPIATGNGITLTTQLTKSGDYFLSCIVTDNETGYSETVEDDFSVSLIKCKFLGIDQNTHHTGNNSYTSTATLQSPRNEVVSMKIWCNSIGSNDDNIVNVQIGDQPFPQIQSGTTFIDVEVGTSDLECEIFAQGISAQHIVLTILSVQNNITDIENPITLQLSKPSN